MLDADLADLYGVETKNLKRQVKRNLNRFPADFMFQLSKEEFKNLRSQFGTSSWGGTRYTPMAFTEHGVLMLSSVLNSNQAIQVNIQIMRIFVKMREILLTHKDLLAKITELESKVNNHDKSILQIFQYLKKLIQEDNTSLPQIGFKQRGRNEN